ncbi:RimK family alpha-L-glutamate ligase [Aliikangiella sp. G2MR2-5]|uniref:ATP-grasp domain-containing protein n=1 Tax=Aliikangiella sp. G2MR2-5 TaxID=2788943 RepID=UPI0018AA87C0|nr:hypothetical protein [Aliikangiella sp. G2MR2-5]
MKKCVILSMDDTSSFAVYDHLLLPYLEKAGWQVETLSWKADVDWNHYHLVMIRSPWDYQLDSNHFLQVLNRIDNSSAHLDNPLEVVRWNIKKTYLRDLEQKGVVILPTLWKENIVGREVQSFFDKLETDEIVIKPCIGAGAFDTYRLTREKAETLSLEIENKFDDRQAMVQPFASNILSEGEFSIFYFDDLYSHTILKTPKQGDFRVQEEWGGHLQLVEPETELISAAETVLRNIGQSLLYVRLDFVRTSKGFALMEAELIEPSLYFNLDEGSPERFVEAVERRTKRLGIVN